jgi:hypothetical protein
VRDGDRSRSNALPSQKSKLNAGMTSVTDASIMAAVDYMVSKTK